MPKVTVVTPAFNAATLIGAAIRSVQAQTFRDWEMIIVDDGSDDATEEVVARHARESQGRIRCLHQSHQGPSVARNLALRAASSPFIALLDADDEFLPDRLAATVAELEREPAVALVHGLFVLSMPDGRKVTPTRPASRLSGRIARHIYTRRAHLNCSTITFRRSCLDEVGLFDESLWTTEDKDLWLRMAERWNIAYIGRPIAVCRISEVSLSSDPDRMMQSQIRFVEKNFGRRGCGWFARRAAFAGIRFERGYGYLRAGDRRRARLEYLRGLLWYPFDGRNAYMALRTLLP